MFVQGSGARCTRVMQSIIRLLITTSVVAWLVGYMGKLWLDCYY